MALGLPPALTPKNVPRSSQWMAAFTLPIIIAVSFPVIIVIRLALAEGVMSQVDSSTLAGSALNAAIGFVTLLLLGVAGWFWINWVKYGAWGFFDD